MLIGRRTLLVQIVQCIWQDVEFARYTTCNGTLPDFVVANLELQPTLTCSGAQATCNTYTNDELRHIYASIESSWVVQILFPRDDAWP
jgi:hypothetical protein